MRDKSPPNEQRRLAPHLSTGPQFRDAGAGGSTRCMAWVFNSVEGLEPYAHTPRHGRSGSCLTQRSLPGSEFGVDRAPTSRWTVPSRQGRRPRSGSPMRTATDPYRPSPAPMNDTRREDLHVERFHLDEALEVYRRLREGPACRSSGAPSARMSLVARLVAAAKIGGGVRHVVTVANRPGARAFRPGKDETFGPSRCSDCADTMCWHPSVSAATLVVCREPYR